MLTYLRGIAVAIAVTLAAATLPGAARAQFSGLCDQVTVEYFSKFWHIKPPILRPLNEEMNARQIACGNVYRRSSIWWCPTAGWCFSTVSTRSPFRWA